FAGGRPPSSRIPSEDARLTPLRALAPGVSSEETLAVANGRRAKVSPHDQVDALTGAVEDLAGQFSLQPLLQRILRRAVVLLGGDAGSISSVDEQVGTYRKEADLGVE